MKRHAPSAARNALPILKLLREVLPQSGTVLEIASGSGQHAAAFAAALAPLRWQPSDIDASALASIGAYQREADLPNLLPPITLDIASAGAPPISGISAMVCINMIHISPWRCTEALFAAAQRWLPNGAPLISYGPYRFSGTFTAPSNHTFDAGLRHRNPTWGIRDIDDLRALAQQHQLSPPDIIDMPANNHLLVFRHQ
ncbi:MAG TPA: DUF938 domain-containing protein [Sorangium sp.]|nr:DUF938 domain-containing protein [Sorangium sp.]